MLRGAVLLATSSLALLPPPRPSLTGLRRRATSSALSATRSRAAKQEARAQASLGYAAHFERLIALERAEQVAAVEERLVSESPAALAKSGLCLQGLEARRGGSLFKDVVVRLQLPSARGGKLGKLPRHRFGPGDVVALTRGRDASPLAADAITSEAAVVRCGDRYVDVALPRRGAADVVGDDPRPPLVRLDLYYSGTASERMASAVSRLTGHAVALPPAVGSGAGTVVRAGDLGDLRDSPLHALLVKAASLPEPGPVQVPGPAGDGGGPTEAALLAATRTATAPPEVRQKLAAALAAAPLNKPQKAAVRAAAAARVTLVQGPPGTGKTTTACVAIQCFAAEGLPVLAAAASNVAADNLLAGVLSLGLKAIRVGPPAAVRPGLRGATLDAAVAADPRVAAAALDLAQARARLENAPRTGGGSSKARSRNLGRAVRDAREARDAYAEAEEAASTDALATADVVVASCVSAGAPAVARAAASVAGGLPLLRFGTVVLDECSQATEPSSLIPLLHGAGRVVMFGDQAQLPPTVVSREAETGGLGVSLFARCVNAGVVPHLLTDQYRMHPAIAAYPSKAYYAGKLRSVPAPRDRPRPRGFAWPHPSLPVAFVDCAGGDADAATFHEVRTNTARLGAAAGGGGSYSNPVEVAAVVDAAAALVAGGLDPAAVGVVTPYAQQARAIGNALAKAGLGVEVSTVDGYQGREKEVIVVSAVRSNAGGRVGFLADARRLNVALTRAKSGLVVFGDARTLRGSGTWRPFLDHVRAAGGWATLPS